MKGFIFEMNEMCISQQFFYLINEINSSAVGRLDGLYWKMTSSKFKSFLLFKWILLSYMGIFDGKNVDNGIDWIDWMERMSR